jgi:hypothetical protein
MLAGHNRNTFVARTDSRFSVTVSSDAHRFLIDWWASLTGRSPANLLSFLVEQSIVQALRNGDVPAEAVKAMEGFIEAVAEKKADEYQSVIELAKGAGSYVDW